MNGSRFLGRNWEVKFFNKTREPSGLEKPCVVPGDWSRRDLTWPPDVVLWCYQPPFCGKKSWLVWFMQAVCESLRRGSGCFGEMYDTIQYAPRMNYLYSIWAKHRSPNRWGGTPTGGLVRESPPVLFRLRQYNSNLPRYPPLKTNLISLRKLMAFPDEFLKFPELQGTFFYPLSGDIRIPIYTPEN